MKALVLEEYNKLVYKDVPTPEIEDHEVLVKIKAWTEVQGVESRPSLWVMKLLVS